MALPTQNTSLMPDGMYRRDDHRHQALAYCCLKSAAMASKTVMSFDSVPTIGSEKTAIAEKLVHVLLERSFSDDDQFSIRVSRGRGQLREELCTEHLDAKSLELGKPKVTSHKLDRQCNMDETKDT